MIVVSHPSALWVLFKVPREREIREAAFSPEEDKQAQGQVTNLQMVKAH